MHAALEHKTGREISPEAVKVKEEPLVQAALGQKAVRATITPSYD